MSAVTPGWYKDPAEPTTQRYWDGEGWLGDPLPADATPPAEPPPAHPVASPKPAAPVPPPPPAAPTSPTSPAPMAPAPTAVAPPPGYQVVYRQPAPEPHGFRLANPGLRLVARLIDTGILVLLNAVVNGWFIYKWWQAFWPYYAEFQRRWAAGQPVTDIPPPDTQSLDLVIYLIGVALWFAYEVPAMANNGQTLGKRIVGIKVVTLASDAPLGFGRAIRRWNPLGLPTFLWMCFGIGFVLQFIDCLFVAIDSPLHQALHDKSAGTVVVHVGRDAKAAPAAPEEGREP